MGKLYHRTRVRTNISSSIGLEQFNHPVTCRSDVYKVFVCSVHDIVDSYIGPFYNEIKKNITIIAFCNVCYYSCYIHQIRPQKERRCSGWDKADVGGDIRCSKGGPVIEEKTDA